MERRKESIVFLDTHIVVWLYDAKEDRFTQKAKDTINSGILHISPLVKLELQYLFEINRIKAKPTPIVVSLSKSIGLQVDECSYEEMVEVALNYDWSRDPFDRLLTAHAQLRNAEFVSADETIIKNYQLAIW